ncbi:dynactin subunit 3 [Centruroides vittatus]|uniref:dynactin subunit 3 n=1 Tax=Centruroides vittatus TaxID=120091 RepID=UPI00350EA2B9
MALELMENRVSELERTVYGDEKPTKPTSQCMDTLLSVNTQLQSLIASREKIFGVFAKIEEIEKCLDPDYADELALTDSAKLELILSEEDKICQTAECLQKVNDLKFVLDSQHIKAVPSFSPKLCELANTQLNQQEECNKFSEKVEHLFNAYNKIIRILSQQFILWDEIVTKVELAQQVQK